MMVLGTSGFHRKRLQAMACSFATSHLASSGAGRRQRTGNLCIDTGLIKNFCFYLIGLSFIYYYSVLTLLLQHLCIVAILA